MTTTTTTTLPSNRIIEFAGIKAPSQYWQELGFTVYSNTNELGAPSGLHPVTRLDLQTAIQASGSTGINALAWLHQERKRRNEEMTRSTATARLAEAIEHFARVAPSAGEAFQAAARSLQLAAEKLAK